MTPEIALINAVRTRLKADSAVAAAVGAKVFDEVPEDKSSASSAPYVYVGPAGRQRRLDIDCYQAWTQQLRVYVISTGFNRTQAWELIETIIASLDHQELSLPDPFSMQERITITRAGDVVDPLAPKSVFVDLTTTIARAP